MRVLLAFDKFKGTLSAREVCDTVAEVITTSNSDFSMHKMPLADGGDGTLEILKDVIDHAIKTVQTSDPLGRPVSAEYLSYGSVAYVELANASGITHLKKSELDILSTTTVGTGEVIRSAIADGADRIVLALGGSCTNEMGLGILSALGFVFSDGEGRPLIPSGGNLIDIRHIHTAELPSVAFTILCDVQNPLYGARGAARVYGPQKGAGEKEMTLLDAAVQHMEKLIFANTGKRVGQMPGAGAAGGIAAGLYGLLPDVEIRKGISYLDELLSIRSAVANSDLVMTGEGRLDDSSLDGKVVSYLAELCRDAKVPLHVIAGDVALSEKDLQQAGITSAVSLTEQAGSAEAAMSAPLQALKKAVAAWMKRHG